MSRVFGLVGQHLGHSFSKNYFEQKFSKESLSNCSYTNFELPEIGGIQTVFELTGLCGLNVTIPYKESVIPYLDELDPAAAEIGAVNTICIKSDGRKIGYNTDYIGFLRSLQAFGRSFELAKVLVLGTGGASKAVIYALQQIGASVQLVSRAKRPGILSYTDIDESLIQSVDLIINTTPLGMFPDMDGYPDIPYHFLTRHQHLYDLIYNPKSSKFLNFGKEQDCPTMNGQLMLEIQAEEAWKIWNEHLVK